MRETEGTHRALTGDVMNKIDSAIGKLCNTDSITKSQLHEDLEKVCLYKKTNGMLNIKK